MLATHLGLNPTSVGLNLGVDFLQGVCKLQSHSSRLTELEAIAVQGMRKPVFEGGDEPTGQEQHRNYAAEITESARLARAQNTCREWENYIDTRLVQPTSNICERFFCNLECALFLKCNRERWDVFTIAAIKLEV
jgi:hypothetical protein